MAQQEQQEKSDLSDGTTALRGGVWVAPDAPFEAVAAEEELGVLTRAIPPRRYARGQRVHRLNDPADGFFVVLSGRVKIGVPNTSAGERVLAVCGPGDLFGTSRCMGEPEHLSEAMSLADGTLVVNVTCERLREVVRAHPDVALKLTQALSTRIGVLEEQVEHARLPVQARLARTLLSLAKRFGTEVTPDVFEVRLALRHDEIASLAGAGRISVTQALSAWRAMGIVTGTRGTYQIDVARLAALTELLEFEQLK